MTINRIDNTKFCRWKTESMKNYQEKYQKKYRQTINGHLRHIFQNIKDRCINPKCMVYKYYGGRNIKCLFESANEFVDYVTNILGFNTLEKLKGLEIDRIDNNGHYEKGNIRFITHKENCNNRRNMKNYTNQLINGLWVKHLATFDELCQYKQRVVSNILAKNNRHKYWYVQCTVCNTIYVIRSDYLSRKICKCQKRKSG